MKRLVERNGGAPSWVCAAWWGFLLAGCGSTAPPSPVASPARPDGPKPAPAVTMPTTQAVSWSGAFLSPMPVSVTSFGAAAMGGHVYAAGGYFGQPHQYTAQHQSRVFARLSLQTGEWERLADLEAAAQSFPLVVHGEAIYRVGGLQVRAGDGESGLYSLGVAQRYDPQQGVWTALPSLPTPRSSHDAVVAGDKLYVVGGWHLDGGPQRSSWHRQVAVLDLAAEKPGWTEFEAPFSRRALAVATSGGKLYALGGMDETRTTAPRVDVYDIESAQWTRGPDLPASGFGMAAVGTERGVFVSLGDGGVYRLDDAGAEWERIATLAYPRFFHRLVAAGPDALLALGGTTGMGQEDRVALPERVPLDASAEVSPVSVVTLPNPSSAKNRQGLFIVGNTLHAFGGNTSLAQHDFQPENFVKSGHRLHIPSLTWSAMADFPHGRQTIATVEIEDGAKVLAVAGFGHDGTTARSHRDVFAFDPQQNRWSEWGQLPRPRTQFGTALHQDRLFLLGGLDYDDTRAQEDHFQHLASVLSTSVKAEAAFEETDFELPAARRAFAGAVLDGRYYLLGGMGPGFAILEDAWSVDLESGKWQRMPAPSAARLSGDLVPLDGKLYLIGGSIRAEGGMQSARNIEVYDPATKTWSTLVDELPFETRHLRALPYQHRLLLYSVHQSDPVALVAFVDPRS